MITNNGGLEEPMANWARPKVERWTNRAHVSELGGKRYRRLPGHRGVIAHGIRVRGLGYIYHLRTPLPTKITMLSTARVLISLHLAFFISHLPPLTDHFAPPLPLRDASAVTISYSKGSDSIPKRLRQWNE